MSGKAPFVMVNTNAKTTAIFEDCTVAGLFFFFLLCASRNEYRGLQPGQLYTSKKRMEAYLHIGRQHLKATMDRMELCGLIHTECSQYGTLVTIIGWEHWSCGALPPGIKTHAPMETERTAPEVVAFPDPWAIADTGHEQFVPTTDNDRQGTERKQRNTENIVNSVSLSSPSHADDFDRLWFAYPAQRRTRKAEAGMLYERAVQNGATIDAMLKALDADMQTVIWEGGQGKYVPGIVKWLEREAWRDYMTSTTEEYVCQEY